MFGNQKCLPLFLLLLLLYLLKVTHADVEIVQGDQLVTLGQTRFLSCVTSLSDVEKVVWKKDGIQIEKNDRVSLSDVERELLIEEIMDVDVGSYVCQVTLKNNSTSSSKPVKLTLYENIKFEDCITTTAMEKGKDGQITCSVASVPKATLTWKRNNVTISKKDLKLEVEGEVLRMKELQNDAVYSLVAKQRIPGIIKRHHVVVTVFEKVVMDASSGEVNATEGEEAVLTCKANSHPHPIFNFYNGSMDNLEDREGYRIERKHFQATLRIIKTSSRDMGDITCSASNQFSQANTTFFLNVLQAPRVLSFNNVTTTISQKLHIECQAYANPLAYIEIGKVQDETLVPIKQRSKLPATSFTFILESKSISNQGEYYCLCTHDNITHFPHHQTTNFVEILYKPMIEEERNRKVVKTWAGHEVELVCVVRANPAPSITWITQDDDHNKVEFSFREDYTPENSTPLQNSQKMFRGYSTREPHDYYHSHIIVIPTERINRILNCKASNNLGSVEEAYEIQEAFVPHQPTIHGIFDIKATSIRIKVSVENDGGAEVIQYTTICYQEGKSEETQVMKNINISHPNDVLYVDGLRQKTKYIVQVAAVNGVGTGEFSTSNATTKDRDVPFIVNVTMESLACEGIDDVNVIWTQPYSSGLPVTMYRVGYRVVKSDKHENETKWTFINTIEKSIKLIHLEESSKYEVYVLAQNDVGWGKEGIISNFNTCRVRSRMRGSCRLVQSNLYFVACLCVLLAVLL